MNLCENPFWILKASPTDSRQRLMELEREGELLGNGKEARDACQALSMRYSRLSAEIRWFPGAGKELLAQICGQIQKTGRCAAENLPEDAELSHIARLNLAFSCMPESIRAEEKGVEDQLIEISTLFGKVSAEGLRAAINHDREGTGFLPAEDDEVRDLLSGYGREMAREICIRLKGGAEELADLMGRCVKRLEEGKFYSNMFLEELFAQYELKVAPQATEYREKLVEFLTKAEKATRSRKRRIVSGLAFLHQWNSLIQPSRAYTALRGLKHAQSAEVFAAVFQTTWILFNHCMLKREYGYTGAPLFLRSMEACFGDWQWAQENLEDLRQRQKEIRKADREEGLSILSPLIAGALMLLIAWLLQD